MVNPWVQFGINAARPQLGLVGLTDAEAMAARKMAWQPGGA